MALIEQVRSSSVYVTAFIVIIALVVNFQPTRDSAWQSPHPFSVHAYAEGMHTSTQFAGPFISKVRVRPSDVPLAITSGPTQTSCTFTDEKTLEKCKMMRSATMYMGNVARSWSVLGDQSAYTLTKHLLCILLAFLLFWCCENTIFEQYKGFDKVAPMARKIVVLAAVFVFVGDVAADANMAVGSVSTGVAMVVLCFCIICFEYASIGANVSENAQGTTAMVTLPHIPDAEKATGGDGAQPPLEPITISTPLTEHMHRNIYLSYTSILMLPLVAVLVLSMPHLAVVDVHIQLIFFSFIFYATLDVFQTRTTAILLCSPCAETAENKPPEAVVHELHGVNFFVGLAFILCKCFALVPVLVLLGGQYNSKPFQIMALVMHYILLFGFALMDLCALAYPRNVYANLLKQLIMFVYIGAIGFGAASLE